MSVARVTGAPPLARDNRPTMLLLALLALWSLVYDGTVAHAHQHAAPRVAAAEVRTTTGAFDAPCALCTATATLEALLLPTFPVAQMALAAAAAGPFLIRHHAARRSRAHDWRSRAPPHPSPAD